MSLGISSVVVSPEPSFTGGEQGPSGVNGLSAYQIAVVNGFVGTEQQWLVSIGAAGSLTISSISGLQTALDGKQVSGSYATLVGGVVPNTLLSAASTLEGGVMSASDKIKLDGVESQANKYIHPTTDGNLHVPATGTSNNGKILKAGATAGSFSWDTLSYNDLSGLPSLGSAASTDASNYATSLQGGLADTALQPVSVDYKGAYNNGIGYGPDAVVLWNGGLYKKISNWGNPGYPPSGSDWEAFNPAIGSPAYDLWLSVEFDKKQNLGDYATLVGGLVPSTLLPSYVDDVIEVPNYTALIALSVKESGKIYVDIDTNKSYRWSGSTFIEISSAYTHPTGDGNLHVPATGTTNNGLVLRAGATAGSAAWGTLSASDVGISNASTLAGGLMSSSDKTKLDGVATGATNYTHPTGDGNSHVPATGITNNGKVLKAGATAGNISWGTLSASDVEAAGTSTSNTFSQPQIITGASASAMLRVTQTGAGEALRVEDSPNPDSTPFVVSSDGKVGVGIAPDAAVGLSVDSTGIKFSNGSIQTVAAVSADFTNYLASIGQSSSAIDTVERNSSFGSVTASSGTLFLMMFTPIVNITITKLYINMATAAGGPTLFKMGVYSYNEGTNTATLLASTANTTSAVSSNIAVAELPLSSPTSLVLTAGTRYAIGFIGVYTGTAPSITSVVVPSKVNELAPVMAKSLSTQTDLPASAVPSSTPNARFWLRASA